MRSMTGTKSIQIIVTGYKVTAFANRNPKQTESALAGPVLAVPGGPNPLNTSEAL